MHELLEALGFLSWRNVESWCCYMIQQSQGFMEDLGLKLTRVDSFSPISFSLHISQFTLKLKYIV